MNRKLATIIWVGATVLAGMFLLGYYTTYLLWEDLRPWRTYRANFARTIGLAKEDPVYVMGLKVGRVHQILLEGDHQLVEIQVEPAVHFHGRPDDGSRQVKVVIEPVDSFGNVGIFVDPGRPEWGFWPPELPIPGTFRESLAASSDSQSPTALSESLKELEAFTESMVKIDGSWIGKLINDPDPGLGLRESFEDMRTRTRNIRYATQEAEVGDGFGLLLAADNAVTLGEALRGTRENIQGAHEALGVAARGEGGITARLVGDREAATTMRETLGFGAGMFRGYQHAEGGVTGILSHGDGAAERLGGILDGLARQTGEARFGEGSLGGFFGPESGRTASESLAGLAQRLEAMSAADPSAGTFFSRAPEGRRATEDVVSRIDDVLRDMRRALGRIRADQAPNTFPGALLSVF